MSNTDNNIFTQDEDMELEAIFKNRDEELLRKKQIEEERKRQQKAIEFNRDFRSIELAVAEQIRKNEPPRIVDRTNMVMPKSLRRPPISQRLIKFIDEVKEYKKEVIATVLVTAVLLVPLAKEVKTNIKFNNIIDNIKNSLQESNLAKIAQSGRTLTLTESPSAFIERLGISKNDNIRLYLLSLSISENDFDNILRHLGYHSGYSGYLNQLGYYTDSHSSASELYNKDYNEKFEKIIKDLNDNPEKYDSYIQKYPELQFIYSDQNIYVTENAEIFMLNDSSGRSR